MPPRLISLNVGLPRDITWRGKTVRTGVWKTPTPGRLKVHRLNIDGDGQGDLGGHGGPNRPVMVYQTDSYRYWERELARHDFTYGQFGEKSTVDALLDSEVHIGDRFRIGSAVFEVSQPRVTCYRVGMRMDDPQMPMKLVAHHRPGFYFRVLEEGEVGAGDEIIKIADGPEQMTVADIDAMLYLRAHTREKLDRALRIPALSEGWKSSFRALLEEETKGASLTGNPGLAPPSGPPPAWPGFRKLRVSHITRESASVLSLTFVAADDHPLAAALPGQFIVLRLQPKPNAPPVLRNYSLSDTPASDHYRVSVKREENGLASTYIHTQLKIGDAVDVAAPRGSFTLQTNDRSAVLLSAGVGATPVLAMLHALAKESSPREVWWLFAARNREEHPFAAEARSLLKLLPKGNSCIWYSRPTPDDRPGQDFDQSGHITTAALEKLHVPRDADFFMCGPNAFLNDLTAALTAWGVPAQQIHAEIFGAAKSITPGIAESAHPAPHPPPGPAASGPQISFARSNLNANWDPKFPSLLDFAEACDVPVRWSCRTGVCHMCETPLISGTVAYDPDPLDPPASGNILLCCSKPQASIALDL